jgi:hypothetical protein
MAGAMSPLQFFTRFFRSFTVRDNEIILSENYHRPVFATAPADNVSKRYSFIPDQPIRTAIEEMGWYPVECKTMRRNGSSRAMQRFYAGQTETDPRGTGKHMIRFRNEAFPQRRDSITELLFVNAHDRSGALEFYAGIFGMICSNGCIAVRQGLSFKVYHVNLTIDKVVQQVTKVGAFIPTVIETEELFRSINLSHAEQLEYAQRVIDLRWDGKKFAVNPEDLIRPVYSEQSEPTLWNTYQTAQNVMMNGKGIQITNLNSQRHRRAQSIKQIGQTVNINTGLWEAAEKMAVELGHTLPVINVS